MLKLNDVSKVYRVGTFGGKELHAVNNVNFEIGDGEIVSLIGESGSGKSTIGKMILHLLPKTSGEIIFNDADVSSLRGRELKEYYRNVQGVFQDPFSSYNPIFKADRIFQQIKDAFFPEVYDRQWRKRVHASLEDVGLNPDQILGKYPHQLSGGQLQRLLIARALLLDVEFLVADEIISMLDASTRIDVLNLLADLKSRGLSILFITHDLSLGYYVSKRALILYRGFIVEKGATEKVYGNPRHPYTKSLMASVPRLDKKWQEVEKAVEREAPGARLPPGWVCFEDPPRVDENGRGARRAPTLIEVESEHYVACVPHEGR